LLAGKGSVQGLFTFALVGHVVFTFGLVAQLKHQGSLPCDCQLTWGTIFGLQEFDLFPSLFLSFGK